MEGNTNKPVLRERANSWPPEHREAIQGWVSNGTSVFEMLPAQAIAVQRYIVRDGEEFDEQDYLRRLRNGVIKRALADGHGVPSEVLEAHNIDLNKERNAMSNTKTTTPAKSRTIEAKAKNDRVWREFGKGTPVKFYTQASYSGMIDIYADGKGNLARKPNIKDALAYIDGKGYELVSVSRMIKADKLFKGRLPEKAAKPAAKKAAKVVTPKAGKKTSKKRPAKKRPTRKTAAKATA